MTQRNPEGATSPFRLLGIEKSYNQDNVISGLDLALFPGDITLLLGANGAGKSTLLRMCAGLSRSNKGEIKLEPHRSFEERLRETGYAGHNLLLYGALTVRENFNLFASLCKKPLDVAAYAEKWELPKVLDAKVSSLSKGTQTRASLARAFINKPRFLFLDEPSSSLDDAAFGILSRIMKEHIFDNGAESTAVIATHDLPRFLPLATRVVVLEGGKIVKDTRLLSSHSETLTFEETRDVVVSYYRQKNR